MTDVCITHVCRVYILEYTLKQKWRWAGHIARMKDNRWTKHCSHPSPLPSPIFRYVSCLPPPPPIPSPIFRYDRLTNPLRPSPAPSIRYDSCLPPREIRLVDLVVKASASRAGGPWFDLLHGDISGSGHSTDFNTLPLQCPHPAISPGVKASNQLGLVVRGVCIL